MNYNIKIGDKVINIDPELESYNQEAEITLINDIYNVEVAYKDGSKGLGWIEGIHKSQPPTYRLIKTTNNNNLIKTMITSIKNLFKNEPEKSFIKAKLMDENENITILGEEALSHILWEANKDKLKEIADKIIEENKNK